MFDVEPESPDEDSGRLYTPRGTITSKFKPKQLVVTCSFCGRFYSRCCFHMKTICHHYRIVYTDGACSNNGRSSAMAAIGIVFGMRNGDPEDEDTHQFSIPVDDRLDPGARRTNQRAELLAVLEGLKICDFDEERMANDSETREQHDWYLSPLEVIITTDSEYVVKGMSEWLPNWKVTAHDTCFIMWSGHFDKLTHLDCFLIKSNGLRKSNSQRPSNLDLFLKLDAEVEARERRHDCKVKFWHIDRTYNPIAD